MSKYTKKEINEARARAITRARDEYYERVYEDYVAGMKISFCSCCGAEYRDHEGECYTDCMHYEGDKPRDFNPH